MKLTAWSPYLVGAGIGILSWFAFWSANHPLGITTAFEHSAALVLQAIVPGLRPANQYFADHAPKIDWEWMLVLGVVVGSAFSAWLSGDQSSAKVPQLWQKRFGASVPLRFTVAFLAAALMMFGARLADGCTSGHGISGNLQLAASSWLFSAIFFVVAIATAWVAFGRSRHDV